MDELDSKTVSDTQYVSKLERQVATLRRLLDDGDGLPYRTDDNVIFLVSRDVDGSECHQCGGYAIRVRCTPEEEKKHGCGSGYECCARAFECEVCKTRIACSASAPEME